MNFLLFGKFHDIVYAFDVHPYGQGYIVLSDGAEQSAEMHQPVNAVRDHDFCQRKGGNRSINLC